MTNRKHKIFNSNEQNEPSQNIAPPDPQLHSGSQKIDTPVNADTPIKRERKNLFKVNKVYKRSTSADPSDRPDYRYNI